MLDDQTFITQLDQSSALQVIGSQPQQLKQAFDVTPPAGDYSNIVLAGMGGSALAAEFVASWLWDRLPVPLNIFRDYKLPKFVGKGTLLIASSYSGNTEETLSAFEQAEKTGCQIIVISAGGKLQQHAQEKGYPFIQIPAGYQPRMAVLFSVKALAVVLQQLGLVKGVVGELEEAADKAAELQDWEAQIPSEQNLAKQIAQHVYGSPAVIYAGPSLGFLAMKWKIDFNENGKNVAFYNVLPELNHNEFMGWHNPEGVQLKTIELWSNQDNTQIQKRFEVSNELLKGKLPDPLIIQAQGGSQLEQMLWAFQLGGFASLYLAFLNKVDPTPVALIEELKKRLA